ncbi:putative Ig domain-containing protein [Mariniblastus fucicola]|uniref:tRNA(Glu)-specific nuclease WapA n=1 Tax=Mariniblastus fucicola TaxID=980251 RepID=A0A5B9PBH9_9BACT|nr:putative Ig domain-containing protein [Mariniblastus fucicola]QEG20491.1 tRNA(Glu)-specific nuclease WapA precursor [Mariniblastus fucicola]
MSALKAVSDAIRSIFVSSRISSDSHRRKFQPNSQQTNLQIDQLEPRMMLNGDAGEVLFQAGFEDANVSAGQFAFFQNVSGFTATARSVEIQNNHPAVGPASEGQKHLELDGKNGIFVNIDDIQAAALTVELDYSPRAGASLNENTIEVVWNGDVVETLAADGTGNSTTQFQAVSIDLPIDGGSTAGRLEFRSKFSGGRGLGGLMDDVVVTAELNPIAIDNIPDQEVQIDASVNVDADLLPPNTNASDVEFELVKAPVGAALDPDTGRFLWNASQQNITATENRETETVVGPKQTIVFAGFEDVNVASGDYGFFNRVSGWDATARAVEVQHNHPAVGPASQGGQHLELDGRNGIARSFNTVEGDLYELTFDFSPRAGADAETNAIEILWDGNVIREISDDGTNNSSTNFRTVTVNLSQFSGDQTELQFRSKSRGTTPGFGGLIDNVRVTRRQVSTTTPDNPFEVIIRASDSTGRSDIEQFNITINETPIQQAPVFDPIQNRTIDELDSVAFNLTATDADTPNNELRYEAVRIPINATLDPVTGEFRWETNEFSGGYFFNIDVKVTDTDGLYDQKRFRIVVNEVNRDPSIEMINDLTIARDASLSIQTLANDPDRPNDTLVFSLTNSPTGATISDSGEISWTPSAAQLGSSDPFEFIVQVADGKGGQVSESFEVLIDNQTPVLDYIENREIDEQEPLEIRLTASDPNGNDDDLVFELIRGPVGSSLDPETGIFRWTPNEYAGAVDFFNIDVRVSDTEGLSDSQRFRVIVNESNVLPVLQSIEDMSIEAGQSISIQAVATDSDVPMDTLTFDLTSAPDGATVSDDGLIQWSPASRIAVGTFAFTVRVRDGNGGSAAESFNVTVGDATDTLTLFENDDFLSTQSREVVVGPDAKSLSFQFAPEFDTAANFVNDAFEVALVDINGQPLVHGFNSDREAFFNLTEGESAAVGVNTILAGDTVTLDLSHIAEGTVANLVFRLVNNDGDTQTKVTISNIETSASEIDTPLGASFANNRQTNSPVDFTLLQDVTESFTARFGQTSFNEQSDALFTNIALTNVGRIAVSGRILAVIKNLSDVQIAFIEPDGRLPDGRFYIDVTSETGQVAPGDTARTRDFQWLNEANEKFQFELTLLAEVNSAPTGFSSTPPTIVEAGSELSYTAIAIDPDEGQALRYNITRGNEAVSIDENSGVLSWNPTADNIGNNRITVRATDPFGLFTEQTFTVEVVESLQNRPPVFTTDPVVEATASSGFEITTLATGDNPNGVGVISGFQGPRIVTINSDDQTVSVHEGTGNERFDDETTYSTGEPEQTGNVIQGGYNVDVGLPSFINSTDVNDIFGLDQADFNGDGILDLASLTYHRSNVTRDGYFHNVVINFGDGDGGFGEPIIVEQFNFTAKLPFENFTVADLNGDGTADLVWSRYTQSFSGTPFFALYTILGNGDGTFQSTVETSEGSGISDFRVVDLDQDGNLDLVGRRQFVDDIGWLEGNGDGTFAEFVSLNSDPDDSYTFIRNDTSRGFQILDLDGDGDKDIVQARRGDRGIQVLTNDGSTNFIETDVIGAYPQGGFSYYQALQVADFTGDGFLDLFYTQYSDSHYYLVKGTADGFESEVQEATLNRQHYGAGNPAGSDRPIDIDGDGDLDLLIGSTIGSALGDSPDEARVLLNDGTGFFTDTGFFGAIDPNGQPNQDNQDNYGFVAGVLSGDYNRDGISDLVFYENGTGQYGVTAFKNVSVVLGTRPGEFAAGRTFDNGEPAAGDIEVVPGDFNNDGNIDLLTLGGGMIRLGNGDGTFAEPFQATPGRVGDHAVLTDFNNDGNLDIMMAAGGRGSGTIAGYHQVLLGNGDGTFEQSYLELTAAYQYGSAVARIADFNGDGYQDFMTKSGLYGVVETLLNDPADPGSFNLSYVIDLEANLGLAMDIGDFDEDGIVDFVNFERADNITRLQTYRGVGDGTFELVYEKVEPITSLELASHTGDVNKDGHLDLVTFSGNGNMVHLGNGDGTFQNPSFVYVDTPINLYGSKLTKLIDFNEDGNLDLVRVHGSEVVNINLGFGDGTFAKPERYNFASHYGDPQFADIDHDGHLDLIMRPSTASIFISRQLNVLYGSRDGLVDVLTVDLNGDGNEEVLAINEDNDRLKIFVGDNLGGLTRIKDVLVGRAPQTVAAADLDGDGTLELITANRAGSSISVLTGDLESGYAVVDFDVDGAPVDVEVSDIDGDGDQDVVVLDEFNNALWVFTGNGSTTLDAPVAVSLGDVASKFVLADANNDGTIDAVVTLPETNRVMIVGGIGFQPVDAPIYVSTESAPSDVAVVDLNDDGNVDLAITLPESNVLSVHYGLGNGQFARAQQIAVGDTPTRVTTADADEDGRVDLIVANSGDNTASVIFNRFDPNEVYRYDADAIDPDGDDLEYSVVDGPGGLFIDSTTGEVVWAASPDQVGQHTVTLEANDGNGGVATQQFIIDVQPSTENSAPLIATEPVATIGANESFEYQVNSIDDDNDSLRYRIIDGPEGATIDPVTGLLRWDGRTDAAIQLGYGGVYTQGNITIPADESLQPENISVEGWYNFHELTASNGRMTLIKQDYQANFGYGPFTYHLQMRGNQDLVLEFDYENGEGFEIVTPFVAETDRWYHFAFTFDDATREATIFVDGEAVASEIAPQSLHFTGFDSQVGQGISGFETYATIDNYRIWNVARSAAEIQEGLTRQYEDNDQIVLDYRFEDDNTISVRDHSSFENTGLLTPAGTRPTPVPGLANAGVHSFTIGVEDGRGGMTTQTFDVEIVAELRGEISGTIFDDTNGDGIQNDGTNAAAENGLGNWLVFLDDNDNQFADPDEIQTTTDADGNFQFAGLLPGDYPVRVAPVAGFESVELQNVNVAANTDSTIDVAASQLPPSQIQGQLQTEDGTSIGYWKVYADLNENGVRDADEPMSTTDRDGVFSIAGLDAGTYNLRADLPAGWVESADGGLEIDLSADTISTGNDIVVAPTNTSVTGGVHFVSTAPTTVEAREVFRYASVATGISDQAIAYDISLGPDGLSIDPNTGQVAWRPTIDQVGEQIVILRATAADGSIALQSFTVNVAAPNSVPAITSVAPASGFVGKAFVYDLVVQDAERDELSFAIVSAPTATTIDANGRLLWNPGSGDIGNVAFEIEVSHSAGNAVTQAFTVVVTNDSPATTPFIIVDPRSEVGLGQNYVAKVGGTDQLNRTLQWSLVSGPTGLNVEPDGSLRWTPGSADLGEQTIELLASNLDGETESFEFTLSVVGRPVIGAPVIESSPLSSAVIGNEYRYDLSVNDPDGDVLSFELVNAPQGMSIDASRGTIRWTPASDQLGESDVTIEVTDPYGASTTQTFTLKVTRAGGPPVIASTPTTEVNVGGSFLYSVVARDAEGDPLTYRLLEAPDGVSIAETTGEINWTPTAGQLGQQTIIIEVSDGFGGASTQAFSVLVGDGVVNLPPQIESEAPRFTSVGSDYQYQITANDPEGTTLSYSVSRGPAGLAVDENGLVSWTPVAGQTGQSVVTLVVTDAGGASSIESFELDVLAENRVPVTNSFAPAEHFAGEEFQYDLLVNDADSDPLQFELISGPDGATIDTFGRLRWATNNDLIGSHDFEVRVTDPRGGATTQSFTLEVVADSVAPILLLSDLNNEDGRNILPWQGPIRVFARATDNVGIASLTLTANGVDIPLDANGQAAFEFEDYIFNNINLVATAVDVNGNVTTKSIDVDFDYPEGWTGLGAEEIPTAAITSPAEAGTVVGFASIVGTANHENFGSYTLSYRHFDDSEFTTITTSDTAVVNGELGVWDTSLLRNDEYVLRLEVESGNGVMNVAEQNVGLAGELKLGNFQLQFTDMVVPVAGIPIQITRVYDTLQADVEGEFGYGWRLEFRDTNLQVGLPKSGLEDIGIYSAFRPGVKVYLNIPGEGRQGFTFNPDIRVLPGLGGDDLVVARPHFTPDPGVTATLSTGANGYLQVNERGELYGPGNIPYNPAAPNFGGSYELTTDSGIVYRINGATGLLDMATDRNGNALNFTDDGIESDGIGSLISIQRDNRNRITSIVDPAGESVDYEYSTVGDLVRVTDRNGNSVDYQYDATHFHFLSSISDPLGQEVLRTEYDDDGRLNRTFDVNGNELELSFDPENRLQEVTDQFGRTSFIEFDSLGNPVATTDGLGNRTVRTFDAFGNLTSTSNALGDTTTLVLDGRGNALQSTDPMGNVNSYTYNGFDQVSSMTDALGSTTRFEYDDRGNLIAATDAAGNTTTLVRDQQGNAIQTTDALGRTFLSDFDDLGRLVKMTSAEGIVQRFTHDANGQITISEVLGTDGETASTSSTTFDANGNPTSITDGEGGLSKFEYDQLGNLIRQIDPLGVETTSEFFADGTAKSETVAGLTIFDSELDESTGLLNRIEGFDGSITSFEFDAAGRPVTRFTSDSDNNAEPIQTDFIYDDIGRLVSANVGDEEIFNADFDANSAFNGLTGVQGDSTIAEKDALGNTTRQTINGNNLDFTYNELGQVTSVTNTSTGVFGYEYDAVGQLIRVTQSGNVVFEYSYNNDGLLSLTRDGEGFESTFAYNELGLISSTTDANGNTTRYEYDDAGRRTAVVRPDGSRLEDRFDSSGRLIESTNADGSELSFGFNDFGQITSRTDGDNNEVSIEYDEQGRRSRVFESFGEVAYSYDDQGRLLRRDDPTGGFIEYAYNGSGLIASVSTPGAQTEYTYDSQRRLETVVEDGDVLVTYSYDQFGRLFTTDRANGTTETISYDAFGFIKSIVTLDDSGVAVLSLVYTRDDRGLIVREVRDGMSTIEYSYDDRDQLILEQHFVAESPNFEISYSYDGNGNRLILNDSRSESIAYTYDSSDRLTETVQGSVTTAFQYDSNGNLILEFVDSNNQTQYDFNSLGRLVEVRRITNGITETTQYQYNVDGIRVSETVDGVQRYFIFDSNGQLPEVVETYDASGNTLSTTTFGVGLLAETRNGEQRFLHTDDIGSVRFVTSENGNDSQTIDYSGFGVSIEDLPTGIERGFLGEEMDASGGLIYLRARYYDTSTGRFISRDPVEGDPFQPATRYDYAYALNDPRNTIDPTGLTTLIEQIQTNQIRSSLIAIGLGQGLVSAIGIARGESIKFEGDTVTVTMKFLGLDDASVTIGLLQSDADLQTNRAGVALTIVLAESFGKSFSAREAQNKRRNNRQANAVLDNSRDHFGRASNAAVDEALQINALPSEFASVLSSFSFGDTTLYSPAFFGNSGAQFNGAFLSASLSAGISLGLTGRFKSLAETLGLSFDFSFGAQATIQGFGLGASVPFFNGGDTGVGASVIQRGNGPDISGSAEASIGISISIPFDEVTVRPDVGP